MNAILSVAQLLDTEDLQPDHRQLLDTLKNNGNKLLTIIDDILDLSKIEARELKLNYGEFSLISLIDHLRNSFAPQAQQKGLNLNIKLVDDLPRWFIGDDFRLQQILNNLISNALKFTEQGQILVTVAPETAVTASDSSTSMIRFCVTDTGIGIPESQQAQLFQLKSSANEKTTNVIQLLSD